ncbi:MAG: hypothetical protein WD872_10425 [Pirellulaceae bacterium]
MSSPSREHLLGYVLGALDSFEQDLVEQELETNPGLREELRRLQNKLGRFGLTDRPDSFDPPAGLAERTCHSIALEADTVALAASALVAPARTGLSPAMQADSSYLDSESRRFTWVDLLTATAVLIAGFALFFPALSHSRFQAEVARCQNHLRQIGMALHEYSSLDKLRQFPRIEPQGNRGVAGLYAPILVDRQLVYDPRTFVCGSSELGSNMRQLQVPSVDQLDRANGSKLARYHKTMGGSYGYYMGYSRNGQLVPATDARRSNFPLLVDAPSDGQPGRTTANHGGRGQNFAFEDGHVEWVKTIPALELLDDPFRNRNGEVAAGVDADDAVLGASSDRPIQVRLIRE